MTSATFRHPGLLAVQVANVDDMSQGRVELGLGAGWFAAEHEAYGIPFPDVHERFDRLEEQLAIVTGLWSTPTGERFDFTGQHYRLVDAPALPKPVQSPLPVIVGGHGRRRTPALAAQFASEFNVNFVPATEVAEVYGRVRAACTAIGREPDSLVYSFMHIVCCGTSDADLTRRAAEAGSTPDALRAAEAFAGSPAELVDRFGRLAEAGATRFYLQLNGLADLDHLDLVAAEVLPQLR